MATTSYKVTAALVVALVGGKVQHLYHGDIVPANIDSTSLENLKSLGFVASDLNEPETGTPVVVVEIPEGDPADSWKVEQLKAYAAAKDIDLGEAKKKADILAVLAPAGDPV